ncbi:MAG TPA: ATP-binding protein, partial [Candidatus Sulfotelmatobacter sp.]|nr:ATP-binding protein [Candidatus Sulfotelmatobacter sp.]
ERLNHVIDEIRAYIRTLTTGPVTMEELKGAITGVLTEFETMYGIPCTLTTDPSVGLHSAKVPSQQIMPILQESLSNAGRHSGASQVHVRLGIEENMAVLTIHDNGKGFDPQTAMAMQGHYGLQNLHRRAQTAGGSLGIRSRSGEGTVVEVRLPIQKGESQA